MKRRNTRLADISFVKKLASSCDTIIGFIPRHVEVELLALDLLNDLRERMRGTRTITPPANGTRGSNFDIVHGGIHIVWRLLGQYQIGLHLHATSKNELDRLQIALETGMTFVLAKSVIALAFQTLQDLKGVVQGLGDIGVDIIDSCHFPSNQMVAHKSSKHNTLGMRDQQMSHLEIPTGSISNWGCRLEGEQLANAFARGVMPQSGSIGSVDIFLMQFELNPTHNGSKGVFGGLVCCYVDGPTARIGIIHNVDTAISIQNLNLPAHLIDGFIDTGIAGIA